MDSFFSFIKYDMIEEDDIQIFSPHQSEKNKGLFVSAIDVTNCILTFD